MKSKIIEVKVDKRTELLGIMLLISNYGESCSELIDEMGNKEYRDEIIERFSPYKNEKAIKLLNQIIDDLCFNYDAPSYLFMQLNEDFTLGELEEYPFKTRLCSAPIVIEFLNEVKGFAQKIDFDTFFQNHKNFYKIGINQIKNLIKRFEIVEFMKNFYKMDFSDIKFEINLMHFATHGNYGLHVKNKFICEQCLRPVENPNQVPNFIDSVDNTATLYVHEFSHSIINPLTEKYSKIPMSRFKEIQDKMIRLAYNTVESIIDEHIVRAIELVFLKKDFGEEYVEKYATQYETTGFIHIRNVYKKLCEYCENKSQYENFDAFFPKVLEVF